MSERISNKSLNIVNNCEIKNYIVSATTTTSATMIYSVLLTTVRNVRMCVCKSGKKE